MAERTKQRFTEQNLDSLTDFDDRELHSTMQEFLEDEKKANTNIWNFATITGIAMFFVGMLFMIQTLGLSFGPDLTNVIEALPILGGILVTFIGFGFLVGDRKKSKPKRKNRKRKKPFEDFDFGAGDAESVSGEDFGLENDLDSKSAGGRRSRGSRYGSGPALDPSALRPSHKLYKSRSDKKWAGVCGGLAEYFGISSTVIRLLFVITFFASSGTTLLAYIALTIALDKEPVDFLDDF